MAKTDDEKDEIDKEAAALLSDIAEDRRRLSSFLDALLGFDDPHMAAEAIAKIADSLTKQNMLRVSAIKAKIKKTSGKGSTDDMFDEIGRPFQGEEEGDQN